MNLNSIPKTDRRSSETQDRLIQAAVAMVFEHGYTGATMARIATAAGVTRGAIQHHFGDRRIDLIARACEHILAKRQQLYRDNIAIVARQSSDAVTRATFKAAYRDPETWFLIEVWIAARSEPSLRAHVDGILERVNDSGDTELQKMLENMGLQTVDFRVFKYLTRSLMRGIALEFSRKPNVALFDAVVDLMFDALEARAAARRPVKR